MIWKLESSLTGKRSSRIGRNVQDMELADSLTRDQDQDQDQEDEEEQDLEEALYLEKACQEVQWER